MLRRIEAAAAASLLTLLAAGCGTGAARLTGTGSVPIGGGKTIVVNGRIHGGQQPISGALVQLYAVGMTGTKSAATPLVGSTVVTDATGSFSLAGTWDCTSNTAAYGTNPLIYIVGTGGNPGLGGSANNTASSLMAAIGPCSSFTAASYISVNELTTIAAVFALAPFMADYAHVGASGSNAIGLVNAFQTASALANSASGQIPGPSLPANATMPQSEVATLADILAPCINSSGTDGNCAALFAAATPPGGSAPVETIGAALDIAHYPANNVQALFDLTQARAPYQPLLTKQPNDWTVALNFTGGGLNSPAGLAIDATGNVWVANAGGNSVTELNSSGALLTGASGYTGNNNLYGAQGIAVDRGGNVWVADTLLSSVVKLTTGGGTVQSSTSYTAGGISGPTALAIDSQNNVWISNFAGGSVTELSSSGTPVGASPLTANGTLQSPIGIALDPSGNVWVTDNSAANVAEFASNQTLLSGTGYTDSAMLAPQGIALDGSGQAWIADAGTSAVSLLGPTGGALPASPYTGGGLSMPTATAVDGAGTVWVVNGVTAGGLSELALSQSSPLSPATGLGTLNAPAAVAVDPSGSVWTANAGDNSVTEFVGLAAPTVTPLAASVGP